MTVKLKDDNESKDSTDSKASQDSKDNTVPRMFQEGIETVDYAYQVFLKRGGKDLQPFVYELQTTAEKSLNHKRIREYLTIIFQEQGLAMAQVTCVLLRLSITLLRSHWITWWWSWPASSR